MQYFILTTKLSYKHDIVQHININIMAEFYVYKYN